MGYNPPTNDPLEVLRRQQEAAARRSREALVAGGTQPFQSVRKLQAQIAELQAQAQELAEQAAAIEAVNDQQSAIITDLSAKQARIDALDLQVLRMAANHAAQSGITLGTSAASYAPLSFTVPAGFTSAIVTGHSAMAVGASTVNAAQMTTRIQGADGQFMNVYPDPNFANGATDFARTLTGLTGGGVVTVETRAYSQAGGVSAFITTTATVIFAKSV
ncbi:hypothetical protein [Xylanimonas ulmi]|uniref:Uncharacterized protein n=1 Tax=Xylanimonas ulmi TaxID=228973 RepID=A0A4Q7M3X3_9MICO|nr:hypothetical protein [Xylanibacterium ulmi]RZS61693.1 hypothetical protein EV386_2003 [Xylanibacterium ulmi]